MREFMRGPMPFLCLGHSFDHMLTTIYMAIITMALVDAWGLPYGRLLELSWFGMVLFGAGAPLAGWLADRWSATGMMTTFFVGIGLSSVATGFATNELEMALGLAAIGLFASIYHPVGIPMTIAVGGDRGGRMLGINGVFGSLGMALAAITAAVLIELHSWRAAFIVPGIAAALLGVWFAIRFRHGVPIAPRKATAPQPSRGLGQYLWILVMLAIMTVGAGMVFQSVTVNLNEIVDSRAGALLGGSALGVGAVVTTILVIGGGAQLLGGLIADRFDLRRAFLTIYGLMIPALVAASLLAGVPMIITLILVVAITVGNQPVADTLFGRYFPREWVNRAYGVRFALSLATAALAIPLAARIHDATGDFFWLFVVLVGFAAAVVLSLVLLPREAPGEAKVAAAPREGRRAPIAEPAE